MSAASPAEREPLAVRRQVIAATAEAAARAVPGVVRVGRGGSRLLARLAGRPVVARIAAGRVEIRLWLVVADDESFAEVCARARSGIRLAVERQLGLDLGSVTVFVDGVAV
ncbi:MAG: Asp23/Gls24 family envelope stress response protein [Candidatus Limnocylindrales bacterium]